MSFDVMESVPQDPEHEEKKRLTYVLSRVGDMLQRLAAIPRYFNEDTSEPQTADEVAQQTVERLRDEQIDALRRSQSEPYFGRLDLIEENESSALTLYIGKRGVEDSHTGDRLVIDWRAPIASIFYSFSGQGLARYEAPDGIIEADVLLKRNLAVRDGQLIRLVDSYVKGQENLNVTDEFLLYRLSEHKESRLRDIVSTIQAEQDRIIRADRNLAIVIQGVAGSGKTTVALHRLAYLLYQHSERMRTHRMVIFAPNAMFVEYISEVLPELGVGGIRQTTFAKWALQVLDQKVALADPMNRYERWFSVHKDKMVEREFHVTRFKGSMQFLKQLEHTLTVIEKNIVPNGDFEPWDGAVLLESDIRRWFFEEYRHYPIAPRRDRVLARVKRYMDMAYRDVKADDKTGSRKKQGAARFRSYSKKWSALTVYDIYQEVLASTLELQGFAGAKDAGRRKAGQRTGRGPATRPQVNLEDLAPLLYIHLRLHGMGGDESFDHVVIDEAQDFSPFQIAVLQHYCPSGSFTILGDLSQSIHGYQGIGNWSEFLDRFTQERREFFRLDVSYRSTMEIIEFANHVIRRFKQFTLAKPVFRSGQPVKVKQVPVGTRLQESVTAVKDLMQQGANTVAVVCRVEGECQEVYDALITAGLTAHQITSRQQSYLGGISVLPVYLTKGLEFDAVLLLDVDAANYDDSPESAKLLYVGCTRALHQLQIHYTEAPSPLITEEREGTVSAG
ncbi:HelD family protein [Alicyclobacillus ferrooxydans]|nr:UvrD-helicase domain-containing protein [Alicyclobacillus ferrooxydans]